MNQRKKLATIFLKSHIYWDNNNNAAMRLFSRSMIIRQNRFFKLLHRKDLSINITIHSISPCCSYTEKHLSSKLFSFFPL